GDPVMTAIGRVLVYALAGVRCVAGDGDAGQCIRDRAVRVGRTALLVGAVVEVTAIEIGDSVAGWIGCVGLGRWQARAAARYRRIVHRGDRDANRDRSGREAAGTADHA